MHSRFIPFIPVTMGLQGGKCNPSATWQLDVENTPDYPCCLDASLIALYQRIVEWLNDISTKFQKNWWKMWLKTS